MADPTPRAGERFTATELRKRASAIYIAVDESVADDIAACLRQAAEDADELVALRAENERLEKQLNRYAATDLALRTSVSTLQAALEQATKELEDTKRELATMAMMRDQKDAYHKGAMDAFYEAGLTGAEPVEAVPSLGAALIRLLTKQRDEATKERDEALGELRSIDAVLARRPALDLPTRWQNIEKAITFAGRTDEAERRLEAKERVLDGYRKAHEENRHKLSATEERAEKAEAALAQVQELAAALPEQYHKGYARIADGGGVHGWALHEPMVDAAWLEGVKALLEALKPTTPEREEP